MQLAESLIYLCWLIADQPRAIDRYIDYFGEGCRTEGSGHSTLALPERALDGALLVTRQPVS
jgi:hypothetical protein